MIWLLPIPGYILSGLIIWLYLTLSAELILFFKKKWITDILIAVLWLLFAIVLMFSVLDIPLKFNSIFYNAEEVFHDSNIYFIYKLLLSGGGVIAIWHVTKKYLKRMQERGYYKKKD